MISANLFPRLGMIAKTTRRSAVALVTSLVLLSSSWAAQLAVWNPTGTVDSTTPYPATSVGVGVTAGNLSLGSGLTWPGSFADAFVGNDWSSGAIDLNDYLGFSVSGAAPGSSIAYQSVAFSIYNNYEGTGQWQVRSSADGFATALASGSFSGIAGPGQLINASVSALGTVVGPVEFRIYTFNNAGAATDFPLQRGIRGTAQGGQGLTVNGELEGPRVVPTPVPTLNSWALLGLAAVMLAIGSLSIGFRRR